MNEEELDYILIFGDTINGYYQSNIRIFDSREKAQKFVDENATAFWVDYSIYKADMIKHCTDIEVPIRPPRVRRRRKRNR